MPTKRKKKQKTELERVNTRKLVVNIRKDLHTMVLEAEGAIASKSKRRKQ